MLSLLHSKRFSISPYGLCICTLIAAATLARFILIYFNWPVTNSDEGNMGLIALHIAYQGDHPTFFYGVPYMGPLEGYIAAPLFRLLGPSLFALRLGLLLLFILFLICMYYLTRLLYTRGLALFVVVLLSLGSTDVIMRQLKAVGEYPEIELFAALISLLAAWLALSHPSSDVHPATWLKWRRILVYGLLGLIVGLALWVDFLILPFVATAGLLLLLFCRRELFSWSGLSLSLGTMIGAFPLIYYNLTAPPGENSLKTLLSLHQANGAEGPTLYISLLKQIFSTIMIGLPLTTGANPHCSGTTLASFGSTTSSMLPCEIFQGGWSMGFLVLWTSATFLVIAFLWQQRHRGSARNWSLEQRQDVILQCCRLMLLISAGLTIVLYVSPHALDQCGSNHRSICCQSLSGSLPIYRFSLPHMRTYRNSRCIMASMDGYQEIRDTTDHARKSDVHLEGKHPALYWCHISVGDRAHLPRNTRGSSCPRFRRYPGS